MLAAGSKNPMIPIVVLRLKRAVAFPASSRFPWSRLLAIVTGSRRFEKKWRTPAWTGGEGARGIADPGDDLLRSRCVDDIFGRTQRRSDRCLVDCSVGLRGDRDKLAQKARPLIIFRRFIGARGERRRRQYGQCHTCCRDGTAAP